MDNYSEGQYVPGKGIALPIAGKYRKATDKELLAANPGADPDLLKLFNAGVFNKSPAPSANLSNNDGTFDDGIMYRNEEQMTAGGVYGQEAADKLYERDRGGFVDPRLDKAQAFDLVSRFGLAGTGLEKKLVGLTRSQAQNEAKKLKEERMAQTSALTSSTFDPKSISAFRDIFKDLKLKVDDNKNQAWEPKDNKKMKNEATINSYTDQLAGLFSSPEEFTSAQQDPEMSKMLRQYEQMGGSRNDIAAKIGQPQEQAVNNFAPEQQGDQSIDQYLGALGSKEQQMAMETLLPEKQIAQDKIAFQASIPEAYKQYYFGSPEQVGLLERKEAEAKETIKLLERRAVAEEKNARARASLASDVAEAEVQQASAEIEKNRLTAKNYMMGQLAKLGALNTTGAAPEAIANLEQKYQQQAQQLNTKYDFYRRELAIDLRDKVTNIELDRDENILKIKEDVSKSEEDAWKEIFKLEIQARKDSFSTINTFAGRFRTQTESYRKELKRDAEKYAKDLAKTASTYNIGSVSSNVREGDVSLSRDKKGKIVKSGVLSPTGGMRNLSEILENSRGSDNFVNSATYQDMFQKFVDAGGTRSEFLTQFPPNRYVNPKDTSLPSFLRFGASARSDTSTEKDERDDF